MKSPIPLELTKVVFWGFLVLNLELILAFTGSYATRPRLHLPELLCGQPKRELVAPPLVLEAIDAPKCLGHGNIEDEVREGEEDDGDPAMAALETRR